MQIGDFWPCGLARGAWQDVHLDRWRNGKVAINAYESEGLSQVEFNSASMMRKNSIGLRGDARGWLR